MLFAYGSKNIILKGVMFYVFTQSARLPADAKAAYSQNRYLAVLAHGSLRESLNKRHLCNKYIACHFFRV